MNDVFSEVLPIWRRRGYGISVGEAVMGERLTHVAFADDMTIISRNFLSLQRMLRQLREVLAKRGLNLHPSKCKAQTHMLDCKVRGSVEIDEHFSISELPEGETIKVLGTIVDVADPTRTEILNRIASGWRCSGDLSTLLLNRKICGKTDAPLQCYRG